MRAIGSALLLSSLLVGGGAVEESNPSGSGALGPMIRNPFYTVDAVEKLRDDTMTKVQAFMAKKIAAGKNNNCTLENAAVRREWADLSEEQRMEYIKAVQCLMKKPPQSPKDRFPGALSRFDDFIAYHMTHAAQLHDTLHLFHAHRQFVYIYEKALREECGYTGYQPYMNYGRYAEDPKNSPMFNGNASSMGGNGKPDPNYKGISQSGRTPNIIKSGGGGGCVTEGPFSDMVVSLGPTSMAMQVHDLPKNPKSDGTGSNPRCLRRDINRNAAMGATTELMYALLTESKDINTFYNTLLGTPPPKNTSYPWGIHTAGHYIHAVDPGGDANTSPGDPVFYFHHGALDRLWWLWQMQDPDNRINAYVSLGAGGMSGMHHRRQSSPDSAWIDLEWLAPKIKLTEANDQLGGNNGAFCYIYV